MICLLQVAIVSHGGKDESIQLIPKGFKDFEDLFCFAPQRSGLIFLRGGGGGVGGRKNTG